MTSWIYLQIKNLTIRQKIIYDPLTDVAFSTATFSTIDTFLDSFSPIDPSEFISAEGLWQWAHFCACPASPPSIDPKHCSKSTDGK